MKFLTRNVPMYDKPMVDGMNLYEYFKSIKHVVLVADDREGSSLASIKYLHMGVDWTLPYVMKARGLILNTEGEIIARPYPKFFNFNQLKDIPFIDESIKHLSDWDINKNFVILDKLDGSLAIFYNYENKLRIASSGQVSGFMVDVFNKSLEKNYSHQTYERLSEITKQYTLNMEFISPENQIVLEYKEEKFVLHGVTDTFTGKELTYEEMLELGEWLGIEVVSKVEGINTLEELLEKIDTLKNIEGFVVVFEDGKRLKFKTDEYVELHRLMENFSQNPYSKRKLNRIFDLIFEDELDDVIAEYSKHDYGKLALRAFSDCLSEYSTLYYDFIFAKQVYLANIDRIKNNKREFVTNIRNTYSKFMCTLILSIDTKYKSYESEYSFAQKNKKLLLYKKHELKFILDTGIKEFRYNETSGELTKKLFNEKYLRQLEHISHIYTEEEDFIRKEFDEIIKVDTFRRELIQKGVSKLYIKPFSESERK